jgi:hypothetical protein
MTETTEPYWSYGDLCRNTASTSATHGTWEIKIVEYDSLWQIRACAFHRTSTIANIQRDMTSSIGNGPTQVLKLAMDTMRAVIHLANKVGLLG